MVNGVGGPSGLPYGYGIGRVQPVNKTQMDVKKEREKQNEEKRAKLIQQKAFLQVLEQRMIDDRLQQEAESNEENHHFDMRV